ncbi:smoothened, frizzled class receptor [Cotesia typhae]|uniref:smoothened, frizzled class receptor n=1 Tax=Cotesia typhae TaxID=2053667 RepID=UPI003D69F1F2
MEHRSDFCSSKILFWIYFFLACAGIFQEASADLPGSFEKDVDSPWDPYSTAGVERSATCVKLKYGNCMGTNLTYSMTSLDLIPERTTQDLIEERLRLLQSLRHIPRCWAVVQPLLCSVFKPKCNNNTIELPSQEFCKKILSPCRILFNHTIWPSFIKCDNPKLFPKEGKDFSRFLPFNISGKCFKPLIATDNPLTTFEGIEGCGIPCNDPLYTADEHDQIHSFIRWGATICMVSNIFTICTFLIDWRSANKYPALVIFYINCCFLVNCFGWMLQFTVVTRESIVCQKDGTLRTQEPSGDTWLCVIVFVLIYYSSMAIMVWFVIFSYAWHIRFKATDGSSQEKITKKSTYFHMFAWSVPLFLTLTVITRAEVDGNSVTGICFVGYTNPIARSIFVLGPILVGIIIGGYFLSRGLITLISLKIQSQNFVSERAYAKIRDISFRMVFFSLLTFFVVIITMYCHIHEFQNSYQWRQSFRDYIICAITTKYDEGSNCKISSRPSVTKLQLHLLAPFLAGVLMSLWVWNSSTVDTWKRFFRRRFNPDPDEPVKLKKHKVIAQAFAKRKTFNNAGRLSISFHNSHDPVGLNFDLNSVASQDFSSTWAAALPKFVTRRDALIVGNGGSMSSYRRNSVDSEVSYSVQRVSVHSRRNSLDSQISVQIAEVKACRKRGSSVPRTKRSKQKKFAKSSSRVGPLFRRGSTTSQESHHAQILSALAAYGSSQIPNMKRRSAMADLDDSISNSKILYNKNTQILLPIFFGDQSESDNSSVNKSKTLESKSKNADDKDEHDSESEDSEADEETKMLNCEEDCGRSRSSKSGKTREAEKSKFCIQNEVPTKHFSQELDKFEAKKHKEKEVDKDVLKKSHGSDSDFSPDITRSIQSDAHGTAREMATQTSLPLDVLEMEELKQSIDEIINSRNSSSKATQMSPQLR